MKNTVDTQGYFRSTSIDVALTALLRLPNDLRPQQYADGEIRPKRGHSVDNSAEFAKFVENNPQGYTLFAERCHYGITPRFRGGYGTILAHENDLPRRRSKDGGVGMTDSDAEAILEAFESGGALFCHACSDDEYDHRNRYVVELDALQTLEAWVGRDLSKYLPGLYWRCSVPVDVAQTVGLPNLDLPSGTSQADDRYWRLQMAGTSSEWRAWSAELDEACARLPGVFSLDRIRPDLLSAQGYAQISAVIRRWL